MVSILSFTNIHKKHALKINEIAWFLQFPTFGVIYYHWNLEVPVSGWMNIMINRNMWMVTYIFPFSPGVDQSRIHKFCWRVSVHLMSSCTFGHLASSQNNLYSRTNNKTLNIHNPTPLCMYLHVCISISVFCLK